MTTFSALTGPVLQAMNKIKTLPVNAMPTPFPTWNRYCRDEGGGVGLAMGWHVIVAGNTGQGKSLLGLNLAVCAIRHGQNVGYISLEMSEMQLATRLQAIVSGINSQELEHGCQYQPKSGDEAANEVQYIKDEHGAAVYVNDEPLNELADIEMAINILRADHDCTVFVVDYLQLAWTSNPEGISDRVTAVSHSIRRLAQRLNFVSIGISQFNRSVSAQRETPIVQGLMGGSSLENDADQVLLLDHTSYKRESEHAAGVNLLLAKNRHGPSGKIPCHWDYRSLRITEDAQY